MKLLRPRTIAIGLMTAILIISLFSGMGAGEQNLDSLAEDAGDTATTPILVETITLIDSANLFVSIDVSVTEETIRIVNITLTSSRA